MKNIALILLIFSFVFSALNLQGFITIYTSEVIGQALAYSNLGIIILSIIILIREPLHFPNGIKIWLIFFGLYFSLGLLAAIIQDYTITLAKHLIPIFYLLAFSMLLSNRNFHSILGKTITITFVVSCILLVILQRLNFSFDVRGVYEYQLNRAEGVYGDANNAAIVCLLSFLFVNKIFKTRTKIERIIKILLLSLTVYTVVLTFSKTAMVVLVLVILITYNKVFKPKRILLFLIAFPILLISIIQLALSSNSLTEIQKDRIINVANIFTLNTDKIQYSERDVLLQNMMNFIYENPIIGNGINFSVDIRGHNTILGVWADAGILTFLFFLFLIIYHFRKALQSPREIKFFVLGCLVVLTIFMLSLQTIINQSYLIVVFVYLNYLMASMNQIKTDTVENRLYN